MGQTRSFGDVSSMSGLSETGHGWAIYEYTPLVSHPPHERGHPGRCLLRRKMCRARSAEVPPLLNRPKGLGGPQPTGWPQPKARLNKRVALIGAGTRLNEWRLSSGSNGSYIKRLYIRPERRAKLCIAVFSEDQSSAVRPFDMLGAAQGGERRE